MDKLEARPEPPEVQAVIIKGPGAVGKSEIIRQIQSRNNSFQKVIRHTTRIRGVNEVSDVDYHFVNEDIFKQMIVDNNFIEYKRFVPGYYGTSYTEFEKVVDNNKIALLDLDPDSANLLEEHLQINNFRYRTFFVIPIPVELFVTMDGIEMAANELEHRMISRARVSDNGVIGAIGRKQDAIEWFKRIKPTEVLIENINGQMDKTIENILNQVYNR